MTFIISSNKKAKASVIQAGLYCAGVIGRAHAIVLTNVCMNAAHQFS